MTKLYYLLAFFGGTICKIYDDLYDNNLYNEFGIKNENEIFINELLKCSFIICSAILSLKNTYFFILIFIMNIIVYLMNKDDFKSYEIALMISHIILIPFLNYENIFENVNDLYFLFVFCIFEILAEGTTKIIKEEYSFKKLIQRFSATILLIILLIFNHTNYSCFSSNINCIIFSLIGYTFTSSLFQSYLLYYHPINSH